MHLITASPAATRRCDMASTIAASCSSSSPAQGTFYSLSAQGTAGVGGVGRPGGTGGHRGPVGRWCICLPPLRHPVIQPPSTPLAAPRWAMPVPRRTLEQRQAGDGGSDALLAGARLGDRQPAALRQQAADARRLRRYLQAQWCRALRREWRMASNRQACEPRSLCRPPRHRRAHRATAPGRLARLPRCTLRCRLAHRRVLRGGRHRRAAQRALAEPAAHCGERVAPLFSCRSGTTRSEGLKGWREAGRASGVSARRHKAS